MQKESLELATGEQMVSIFLLGNWWSIRVFAGIDPSMVLPLVIDAGTNREELRNNPNYLGNRHERVRGDRYYDFIDQFVQTAERLFPKLYLHWEDFSTWIFAHILEKYRKQIPTFNDDIQGTGIVTLGGIFGSLDISGEKLTDQVYLCYGGGTAGAGIASRVLREMVSEGLSEEEAYKRFFMVDKQGLLFDDMDDLTPEQNHLLRNVLTLVTQISWLTCLK